MDFFDVSPNPDSMLDAFVWFYNNNIADFDVPAINRHEAFVVWFCYIVGNAKCLISTTRPDHMYYELTYHPEKKQLHIDAYKKVVHKSIDFERKDD